MKVAPLWHALSAAPEFTPVLVHTGQHYDAAMSDDILADLHIPPPDHHLGVGSGSHAEQTGRVDRIDVAQGFGFIVTPDGREFYFSRDNVVTPSFENLSAGTVVHFIEDGGGEGPQAKRVSAHGRRAG